MIGASQRATHRRWLLALTGIPTAAGREERVISWVDDWVGQRSNLTLKRDTAGNMLIRVRRAGRSGGRPVLLTAHLDHPAFVVRRRIDQRTVELEFRGGVRDPYFDSARIEILPGDGARRVLATVTRLQAKARPFKRVTARLGRPAAEIAPGDIARWSFRGRGGAPTVHNGLLHAPACDDLAGVAAALSALDVLRRRTSGPPVGVLLTRAEEVGFLGAIAACKLATIPAGARLLCLENSRSFKESPIGGGPILRVGDKLSVFSPALTNRLGLLLEAYRDKHPRFKAQRRLMPGGTCEATTFAAFGHEATCLCLPLGNYHNMVDIDGVLAGKRPARVGPERIALADYHGLVELLVHFASHLDSTRLPDIAQRMETRLREHGAVLGIR